MRFIKDVIADELRRFLSVTQWDHFSFGQEDLIYAIEGEVDIRPLADEPLVRLEGKLISPRRAPALEFIEDASLVIELGNFLDELKIWMRETGEIREQWLWDHIKHELPKELGRVFGFTGPLFDQYERILSRARRLLFLLERKEDSPDSPTRPAVASKTDSESPLAALRNKDGLVARKDLLAFYDIAGSTLNDRIDSQGHPEPIKCGRKHFFRADECDQWLKKQSEKE
ncbi:hypothetical protein [Aureliella helgolandensis]|uniref:Uncharacterized protein n=1 Tax=Aureliella helgolandensis TaxID=2527968 RepID=A0A518G360_9BACT|nr:hypothetical protein [Aureliella helgolandensis]QDV23038.1 hypothetical protein Q31a_13310 [Aureliella helgolandensis]